jgi:uncharacterized membrane protein
MYRRTGTERALGVQAGDSRTWISDAAAAETWALAMWTFETDDGADQVIDTLLKGNRSDARVSAAAAAQWPQRSRRPATRTIAELSEGVLSDIFWSTFFGLVFYVPLVDAAMGRPGKRAVGVLGEAGIDDQFVNQVRDRLIPGSSALFLLTTADDLYRVVDAAAGPWPQLIVVCLKPAQKETLSEAFGPPA